MRCRYPCASTSISYLILAVCVALTAVYPLMSQGVWRRVLMGREFLAGGIFPRTDTLSYAVQGRPMLWESWLFDVALGLLPGEVSASRLALVRVLLVMGLFLIPTAAVFYRRFTPWRSLGLIMVLWTMCRSTFRLHPILIGHWGVAVLALALPRITEPNPQKPLRPPLLFGGAFLLFALWSNLGGAPLLGLAVSVLYGGAVTADLLNRPGGRDRLPEVLGRLGAVLAGGALGMMAHPAGPGAAFLSVERFFARLSPDTPALDGMNLVEWPELGFFFTIFALCWAIVFLIPERFLPFPVFLTLSFSLMPLLTRNLVYPFGLFVLPACWQVLEDYIPERARYTPLFAVVEGKLRRFHFSRLGRAVAPLWSITLAGVLLGVLASSPLYPRTLEQRRYATPEEALRFLDRLRAEYPHLNLPAHLYTSGEDSPFISWWSGGKLKIWMDDRSELYSSLTQRFPRDLSFMRRLLDDYQVTLALLPIRLPNPDRLVSMNSYLRSGEAGYAVIYFDDRYVLFLKELPEYRELLDAYALRQIHPELDWSLESEQTACRALLETERLLALQPESSRIWRERLRVATYLEDVQEKLRCYEQLWQLNRERSPEVATKYAEVLVQTGQEERAIALLYECISFHPTYGAAYYDLGTLFTVHRGDKATGRIFMERGERLDPSLPQAQP